MFEICIFEIQSKKIFIKCIFLRLFNQIKLSLQLTILLSSATVFCPIGFNILENKNRIAFNVKNIPISILYILAYRSKVRYLYCLKWYNECCTLKNLFCRIYLRILFTFSEISHSKNIFSNSNCFNGFSYTISIKYIVTLVKCAINSLIIIIKCCLALSYVISIWQHYFPCLTINCHTACFCYFKESTMSFPYKPALVGVEK